MRTDSYLRRKMYRTVKSKISSKSLAGLRSKTARSSKSTLRASTKFKLKLTRVSRRLQICSLKSNKAKKSYLNFKLSLLLWMHRQKSKPKSSRCSTWASSPNVHRSFKRKSRLVPKQQRVSTSTCPISSTHGTSTTHKPAVIWVRGWKRSMLQRCYLW
jgi:hypothetical protein